MENTNPFLKFALGAFNILLALGLLAAILAAVLGSLFIFIQPIPTLFAELFLLPFIVFAGTYTSRSSAFDAQKKAQEKIELQRSAGAEIEPDDKEAATAKIPSYMTLLKRNAVIMLFLAPLILVITGIAFGMLFGITFLTRELAQNRTGAKLILQLFIPVPLFGWFWAVGFVWSRVGKFVDERIFHTSFDMPVDEETRQKRRMQEMLQQGSPKQSAQQQIIGFLKWAARIVVMLTPILFALWLLNDPTFPEGVRIAVAAIIMIGYMLGIFFFVPRWMKRSSERRIEELKQKAIEEAATPKEANEVRQAFAEMEAQERVHKNSAESLGMNRAFKGFMGMIVGILVLAFGAGFGARALGADGETAQIVLTITLGLGILAMFTVGFWALSRFMPNTAPSQTLLEGYEPAMRKGDYATLTKIVDHAMEQLPNWETKIPGAAAYMQMGKAEEAERIAKETLAELSQTISEDQRAMRKPIMGHVFGLLAEIYIATGRLAEAETYAQRAAEYGDNGYQINNTLGKLYLYRQQPDLALKHIETATQSYTQHGQAVSAYNVALRAWAMALKGNHAQADTLMGQAFKQTPTDHATDHAELYLIGSYVMNAQGKQSAAHRSLEKAQIYDRYGMYGMIAQREMNGTSN